MTICNLCLTSQETAALRTLLHYWLNTTYPDRNWVVWEDDVSEGNDQLNSILSRVGPDGPLYSSVNSLEFRDEGSQMAALIDNLDYDGHAPG